MGDARKNWFERRGAARAGVAETFAKQVHAKEFADRGFNVRRDGGDKPLSEWLRHDGVSLSDLEPWLDGIADVDPGLVEEMAEDEAYAPYLARQEAELRDLRASEELPLPSDFPYDGVPGLSNEMIERLTSAAPTTLAAAGRVPGITPAALSALLVHARRWQNGQRAA